MPVKLTLHDLLPHRGPIGGMMQPVGSTSLTDPYLDLRIVLAAIIEVVPEARGLRQVPEKKAMSCRIKET